MKISSEDKKFLELYSDSQYEKPSATVDAVVFRIIDKKTDNYRKLPEKKMQVYLTKRNFSPYKDCYGIIGTFIDLKNELSETMQLCVKNKIGLENYYYEQLFTFGDKSRDPRTRVISISYMLLTNSQSHTENGEWFDIDINEEKNSITHIQDGYTTNKTINIKLSNENTTLYNTLEITNTKNGLRETKNVVATKNSLAFDHIKIIYYATERLKNKLEYTDIIFNLLPEKFTLTELKQCYEVILHEHLLDANFRRKTSKMVMPTSDYVVGKGHRSSQLFTHNPNWTIMDLD